MLASLPQNEVGWEDENRIGMVVPIPESTLYHIVVFVNKINRATINTAL